MSLKSNTPIPNSKPCLAQFTKNEATQLATMPIAVSVIIQAMALASKQLVFAMQSQELVDAPLAYNTSGDEQHPLDRIAHTCFVAALDKTREVGGLVSEEAVGIVGLTNQAGKYIVALDPLDGSSNWAVHAPVGTIFSIYQRISPPKNQIDQGDVLQPGHRQIAAGYMLYSTNIVLVYGTKQGVHAFTYEPAIDAFVLTHQTIRFPQQGPSYAINDGYFDRFPEPIRHYIRQCRNQGLVSRYSGALVADFHRHLLQGGIYLYPATQQKPNGKLRLMFECNALAFIAEQAGGLSSNGHEPVLCMQPRELHECIPFYIGSANMIKDLLAML